MEIRLIFEIGVEWIKEGEPPEKITLKKNGDKSYRPIPVI